MGIRPQPAHIKWPFDEKTAEGIEKNFRTLFQDTKQLGGIVPVDSGGTGQSTFDKGDILYAPLADTVDGLAIATTLGRFLRSDGSLPEWSTLVLPNAAAQGDVLYANATNAVVTLAKDTNATRYLSNTGTSNNPAWAQVALATGVSGTLPVTNGGTGTATAFTLGSVVFAGASGIYTQDNANFFWDDTNNRLGIGTAVPNYKLDIRGVTVSSSNNTQMRIGIGSGRTGLLFIPWDAGGGFDGGSVTGNGDFVGGTGWVARATTSAGIELLNGIVSFNANSGLVAGNTFSPTLRGGLYPSGGAAFLGTVADPGAGIFKIDGQLTVTGLTDLSGAAAGQIKFPATQNASANANTLDDYEEGTWTPTFVGTGGSSGQTYTTQLGSYTKIGKVVVANFRVKLSALGTITTNAAIGGLPFTSRTGNDLGLGSFISYDLTTTSFLWLGAGMLSNSTQALIFGNTAASTASNATVQADYSNTSELIGTLTYIASA